MGMESLYQDMMDEDEPTQGDYCGGCLITGLELVYGELCQDCLDKAVEHAGGAYDDMMCDGAQEGQDE